MAVGKFGHHATSRSQQTEYEAGFYYNKEGLLLNINDPFEDYDVVNKKYLMQMLENLSQKFNEQILTVNENLIKLTKILEDFIKSSSSSNVSRKE